MKKMSVALFVFSILSNVFAEDLKPSEKWSQCSTDDDCVHLVYPCAADVVHKNFSKEAREYYEKLSARIECAAYEPSEAQKKIPYKVFCKAKKCSVQGVKPK